MKNKNWFFIHHHPNKEEWSTPKGFILALRESGIKVFDYSFEDPNNFFFPSNEYFIDNEISSSKDLLENIPYIPIDDSIN